MKVMSGFFLVTCMLLCRNADFCATCSSFDELCMVRCTSSNEDVVRPEYRLKCGNGSGDRLQRSQFQFHVHHVPGFKIFGLEATACRCSMLSLCIVIRRLSPLVSSRHVCSAHEHER